MSSNQNLPLHCSLLVLGSSISRVLKWSSNNWLWISNQKRNVDKKLHGNVVLIYFCILYSFLKHFYCCSITVVPIFPLVALPCPASPCQLLPHSIRPPNSNLVHGSFIHVPWLDPYHSFPHSPPSHFPLVYSNCSFFIYCIVLCRNTDYIHVLLMFNWLCPHIQVFCPREVHTLPALFVWRWAEGKHEEGRYWELNDSFRQKFEVKDLSDFPNGTYSEESFWKI